jgi:hypothetical protein
MNSLPVIEGINNLKSIVEGLDEPSSVKDKYVIFLEDLQDFYKSYNPNNNYYDNEKLNKLKQSLNNYKGSFRGLSEIVKNKHKTGNAEQLIKENKNEMLEDYYIKQESSYYYNLVISVVMGCIIYFTFFQIKYSE